MDKFPLCITTETYVSKIFFRNIHYENLPMQYTEIFKIKKKNENFQ